MPREIGKRELMRRRKEKEEEGTQGQPPTSPFAGTNPRVKNFVPVLSWDAKAIIYNLQSPTSGVTTHIGWEPEEACHSGDITTADGGHVSYSGSLFSVDSILL